MGSPERSLRKPPMTKGKPESHGIRTMSQQGQRTKLLAVFRRRTLGAVAADQAHQFEDCEVTFVTIRKSGSDRRCPITSSMLSMMPTAGTRLDF